MVFLLTFSVTIGWGNAQDSQPVPPQQWQLKGIMAALDDSDPQIWALALEKLSEFKVDELKPPLEIPEDKYRQIVDLLDYEEDSDVQDAALEALGAIGAKEHADKIVPLLSDSNFYVRDAAVGALRELGAKEQAEKIVPLLSHSNSYVRGAAVGALGAMGAKEQADKIVPLLSHSDDSVRGAAVGALGELGAKEQTDKIVPLLSDSDDFVRGAAVGALGKFGKAQSKTIAGILNEVYGNNNQKSNFRYLAYFFSGAEEDSLTLIQWLGQPESYPDLEKFDREQTIKILKVFQQAWQPSESLNNNLSPEELAETQKILSNPMDLTFLSQIIASGESPDIFKLQQQQYDLMAADYAKKQHEQFPLKQFSEHAYQIRLENNSALSESDFLEELQCMERHKMVIKQQFLDSETKPVTEWKFRHDKIGEFFILQTFFGKYNSRPSEHKQDSRFRGVYFLLANLLPLDEAEMLREELIQYAADSGDHTVSDRFVQLLRARQASSRQPI